jgi:hypothetical protein
MEKQWKPTMKWVIHLVLSASVLTALFLVDWEAFRNGL